MVDVHPRVLDTIFSVSPSAAALFPSHFPVNGPIEKAVLSIATS
jgi:hypothetical protein